MATLLLSFFVLMLSFTEMSVPKFKQVSGSMSDAFGVQKADPEGGATTGEAVLDLNFSPAPTVRRRGRGGRRRCEGVGNACHRGVQS